MDYTTLFKKTEQHVTGLFEDHSNTSLTYHNLNHTKYVVDKANEIAGHYQLTERETLVIFIAAWFHDTGYLFTDPPHHEEKGIELMKTFLHKQKADDTLIDEVEGCIMATKHTVTPVGLLQQIVCDADSYNFGGKEFKETNKQVYKEIELTKKGHFTIEDFEHKTIEMLHGHKYYTSYTQDILNDGKQKNLKKLEKDLKKAEKKNNADITEKDGTTKGMQTMLRLTSQNHMEISAMADQKANILISVNAIIISLILSILLRKLQSDPFLTIPTIIFLAVSVTTIVISIMATRPKLNTGTFQDDDVINKKTNLLFFGNFHHVPLDTYDKAMRSMMRDSDYLYSSMIQDIYHLGVVLGRKYKLIRLAYNIFMYGIVVSVLSFAIATFLYHNQPKEKNSPNNTEASSPF